MKHILIFTLLLLSGCEFFETKKVYIDQIKAGMTKHQIESLLGESKNYSQSGNYKTNTYLINTREDKTKKSKKKRIKIYYNRSDKVAGYVLE